MPRSRSSRVSSCRRSVWFGVAAAAALPFVVQDRRSIAAVNVVLLAGSLAIVHRMESGSLWSPYYRITIFQDKADTVVEVNHIFHQSMAPVAQKEYFYQWPYTVFGDTFDEVLILGAGSGTDVAAALRSRRETRDRGRHRSGDPPPRRRAPSRQAVQRSARHRRQRRRAAFPADDDEEVRPGGVRADRFADRAIELLRRAARELHVHARSRSRRCATACRRAA